MLLPLFSAPCFLSSFLLGSFSCFLPLFPFHSPLFSPLLLVSFPPFYFSPFIAPFLFPFLSLCHFLSFLSSPSSPCFLSLFLPFVLSLFFLFPFVPPLLVSFSFSSPIFLPFFLSLFPFPLPLLFPFCSFFLSLFPSVPPPPG